MKVLAYHCRHCGAPVDPEQEICGFCKKPIHYKGRAGSRMARVLIDNGNDFVYYDTVTSIQSRESYPRVETTTLESSRRMYMYRNTVNTIDFDMPFSERSTELLNLIRPDRFTIKFELYNEVTFEFKAYLAEKTLYGDKHHLRVVSDSDMKQYQLELPKGITCPNCGGLLKSRYGACDFCNGWVEFMGA